MVLMAVLGLAAGSNSLMQSLLMTAPVQSVIPLESIPQSLGDWQGEDVAIDDEAIRVLGAESYINRNYRGPTGTTVGLHVASWENQETIVFTPHHPNICYPGTGWTILDKRICQMGPGDSTHPVELMLLQKDQQLMVIGFWFQVGSIHFVSGRDFQNQRYQFWGLKGWPKTLKVLIQTNSPTLDDAEETLVPFANMVFNQLNK